MADKYGRIEFADPPAMKKRSSRPSGHRLVAPHPPVAPRERRAVPPKFKNRPKGEQATITERRQIALQMRKGGATFRAIAAKLGVNIRTAFDYVQAELVALREVTIQDAQSLRAMELERCDELYANLQKRIKKGDPFAIGVALKVLERRSKILGIDVPERMEFLGAMTTVSAEQVAKMSDTEIAERLKDMMLRLARGVPPTIDVAPTPRALPEKVK